MRRDEPMTRKPCPGCGELPGYGGRPRDKVCRACADKLERVDRLDAERSRDSGLVPVIVPENWMLYEAQDAPDESLPFDERTCARLNRALRAFADAMTVETPAGFFQDSKPLPWLDGCADRHRYSGSYARMIRPTLIPVFVEIVAAIRKGMVDTHKCGRHEGSSILLQLARGSVSLDDFNKCAAGADLDKKRGGAQ
jgi:hypothetical protein